MLRVDYGWCNRQIHAEDLRQPGQLFQDWICDWRDQASGRVELIPCWNFLGNERATGNIRDDDRARQHAEHAVSANQVNGSADSGDAVGNLDFVNRGGGKFLDGAENTARLQICLLYKSPSPR